jgi:hypothetical protein
MIMRCPSNGIDISLMRGSLIILATAASRASLEGYSNQEKTTVSSFLRVDGLPEVGDRAVGHVVGPALDEPADSEFLEQGAPSSACLQYSSLLDGRNGDHEAIDIGHFISP